VTGAGISAAHAAAIFTTSNQGLKKRFATTIAPEFADLSPSFLKNYSYIYEECTIIVSPKDRWDASLYYSE
jgi:hypothetical protein